MSHVTIPVKWLNELLDLCGPEDHELRERVMKSAAPAAPAVDADLLELAQAIVKYNRQHGGVLAVHINNLADLVDERAAAAQAKEGGEAA